jgi:ABC-type Zn uptake system ZnuABC Zn-binding protein ZnuA
LARTILTLAGTAVVVAIVLGLAGCSSPTQAAGTPTRLRVVAAFYPLQYLAQRIGGDAATVGSLTRPGAEPHDLELTAQDVAAVADAFSAHAASLRQDLTALDEDYRTDLASCAVEDLVTSHNAFGYLARRYGLTQVGITGLDPEKEPSARDLAAVTAFVRTNHVRTIYYEMLASPAIARTVANATGARTAVLDPIEGLTDQSAGGDYLQVMRSNLATLRAGQTCT